jgi:hypothetical protein
MRSLNVLVTVLVLGNAIITFGLANFTPCSKMKPLGSLDCLTVPIFVSFNGLFKKNFLQQVL